MQFQFCYRGAHSQVTLVFLGPWLITKRDDDGKSHEIYTRVAALCCGWLKPRHVNDRQITCQVHESSCCVVSHRVTDFLILSLLIARFSRVDGCTPFDTSISHFSSTSADNINIRIMHFNRQIETFFFKFANWFIFYLALFCVHCNFMGASFASVLIVSSAG